MKSTELKLNRNGDLDLLYYQRLAEQARADAIRQLLRAGGRNLKQLFCLTTARIRALRLPRSLPVVIERQVY